MPARSKPTTLPGFGDPVASAAAGPRPPVLIVDDDADMRALLVLALQDAGFDTHVHADGGSAVKAAVALRPALVILDWMMPSRSGLDVCAAIRALPELAGIRILMVSAKRRDDDVELAYRAGVDRYCVKPVVTRVLVRHVRELVGADGRSDGA